MNRVINRVWWKAEDGPSEVTALSFDLAATLLLALMCFFVTKSGLIVRISTFRRSDVTTQAPNPSVLLLPCSSPSYFYSIPLFVFI